MDSEVKYMLKKVALFDGVVGSLLFVIVSLIYGYNYAFMCILGLLIAAANYNINGIMLNYLLLSKPFKHKTVTSLIYFFRVFIICLIAIIIYKYNKMNVLVYVLGFCSHFISLVLYGLSARNQ